MATLDMGTGSFIGRDALAEVFRRIPFPERLGTLPLVCKFWKDVSYDPACWRSADLQPWVEKRLDKDSFWEFECVPVMEFLVKRIVDLSCGQLTELRTTRCSDAAMECIAERCPSLTVLCFPGSSLVSDMAAAKLAAKCPGLQQLDVSDCYGLSSASLEEFGRNCKSLVRLNRNMLKRSHLLTCGSEDEEAIAVAGHMPNLRHLEMKKANITDVGARLLARGCTQLESLNLAGCTALTPQALHDLNTFCPRLGVFVRPVVPRFQVTPKHLKHLDFSGFF